MVVRLQIKKSVFPKRGVSPASSGKVMYNMICRKRRAASAWRTWKKGFLGGVHNAPITVDFTLHLFILFRWYMHLLGFYFFTVSISVRVSVCYYSLPLSFLVFSYLLYLFVWWWLLLLWWCVFVCTYMCKHVEARGWCQVSSAISHSPLYSSGSYLSNFAGAEWPVFPFPVLGSQMHNIWLIN